MTGKARIEPGIVTRQILGVMKTHCGADVVAGLVEELRRSEALEAGVVGGGRDARRTGREISLAEQDKLDRLITFCHARLSIDEVCQVLLGIGDVFKIHGDANRAEGLYTMALAQAERSGKKGLVAEACLRRGEVYSRTARWKQSASDLRRSRALYLQMKHREALGRIENILGTNHAEQGNIRQAARFFERALTLFERTQQTQMAGVALMNLGITYNILGNYDSAVAHYKRAQSCFEGVGDLDHLAELHHNTGMTYLSKRLFKEAIGEFNTSHGLSSSLQNASLMGLAGLGKATAYFYLRDMPVALKLAAQAIELFARSGDPLSLADAYRVKGMIHREMRSFDAAASYLQTSLRINAQLNNQLNLGESYSEIGILETKRNRRAEAIEAFRKAGTAFRKVGARHEVHEVAERIHSLEGGRR